MSASKYEAKADKAESAGNLLQDLGSMLLVVAIALVLVFYVNNSDGKNDSWVIVSLIFMAFAAAPLNQYLLNKSPS